MRAGGVFRQISVIGYISVFLVTEYFLLKKCEKLLHCIAKASLVYSTKKISVFGYNVVKHLKSLPLNELVKLTML